MKTQKSDQKEVTCSACGAARFVRSTHEDGCLVSLEPSDGEVIERVIREGDSESHYVCLCGEEFLAAVAIVSESVRVN